MQVPVDAEPARGDAGARAADGDEVYVTELTGDKATIVVRRLVAVHGTRRTRGERAAARDRRAARDGRGDVTPPAPRDDLELILAHRGRKRKRADRVKRRRRGRRRRSDDRDRARGGRRDGRARRRRRALRELRPEHARPVEIGQNSFVYARDGSLLGSIPAERNREPVTLRNMRPWLPKATVAIEDRRFYQHGGVDYVGIARAAWKDVTAGKVVEGGSTITQQLVRNLYTGRERTFTRKIKEACLAIKLASKWSKPKILDEYLNTVYYGNHAYGVEAASQTYFSRHASQLTLARRRRCSPGCRRRRRSTTRSTTRRPRSTGADEVLRAMLATDEITLAPVRPGDPLELARARARARSTRGSSSRTSSRT